MRPGIQKGFVSTVIRLSCLMVVLLLCCVPRLLAASQRGAIVCREEVSAARRGQLAHKLRAITGWRDLNFDSHGALRLAAEVAADGGSNSARSLITKTLASEKVLIIEDASSRADVVFARVVPGRWKNNAAEKRSVFVVLIDFTDFERLMGDRPALEAFNVGWSLLHEIDHVVNDSSDAEIAGHAGECEDHINQMRRECHLPARLDYFFTFYPNSGQSDFRTRFVRLAFDQEDGSTKHRRLWVIWDASQVGGLELLRQVAALR